MWSKVAAWGVAAILVVVLRPASALADSASVITVQDAGGGQLSVTYAVTSTSTSQTGYAGWFAYLAEDHASRTCNPGWANYLREVVPFQAVAGSVTRTITFRPFFPRQIKLCIYLSNPAGERAVLEHVASIPAGYGVQRSTGYNCSHFSLYSAQDYYWLYPGDPSGLDADNDGIACEWNDGKPPGPQIPAEPTPPPPACSDGIDNDGDGRADLLDSACLTSSGTSEGVPPAPPQCSDGQDNDSDGAADYPSDAQCKRASDGREAPDPLPNLTRTATRRYIRGVLRQDFGAAYRHGSWKFIAQCNRLSRARMKCRDVTWFIGDISYSGWATIWYEHDDDGDLTWNYAYRIKRTNGYCVARKRAGDGAYKDKRCSKVYRVR
jgi:hypothetical protein